MTRWSVVATVEVVVETDTKDESKEKVVGFLEKNGCRVIGDLITLPALPLQPVRNSG